MQARDRYDSLIRHYAGERDLDWIWCKAQMLAESNANPKAVSPAGAEGLMQFMPATFRDVMGPDADPFNPETSIEAGCKYMRTLSNHYGNDRPKALSAYNWGLGHVDRVIGVHGREWYAFLPGETKDYLRRITALQKSGLTVA